MPVAVVSITHKRTGTSETGSVLGGVRTLLPRSEEFRAEDWIFRTGMSAKSVCLDVSQLDRQENKYRTQGAQRHLVGANQRSCLKRTV